MKSSKTVRRTRAALVVTVAILGSGCALPNVMPIVDATRQPRSAIASGGTTASEDNPAPNATFLIGGDVESSTAIGLHGTIYVGSNDGYLYATHPNLTQKWRFPTGGAVRSSSALGLDGTIHVGSSNRKPYAVSADGTRKCSYWTPSPVRSSPTVAADGKIYVGSDRPQILCVQFDRPAAVGRQHRFVFKRQAYPFPIMEDGSLSLDCGRNQSGAASHRMGHPIAQSDARGSWTG